MWVTVCFVAIVIGAGVYWRTESADFAIWVAMAAGWAGAVMVHKDLVFR
jgi:hypothetical protein